MYMVLPLIPILSYLSCLTPLVYPTSLSSGFRSSTATFTTSLRFQPLLEMYKQAILYAYLSDLQLGGRKESNGPFSSICGWKVAIDLRQSAQ